MASQSLNNSHASVAVDQAAVDESNHGPDPQLPADADIEQHEVNVDQLSESDFEGIRDSGLPYCDHDYLGSNPNVKCPPETAQFPILNGITDQYLNDETDTPSEERTDNRVPGPSPSIPVASSVLRKAQLSGGTVFRPVKGEDFAHPNQQPVPPGKSVSWKQHTMSNVTQPKKSGRPPKTEAAGDRLMGRAMVKAGIQTQIGHLQPQHIQKMHRMEDDGFTVRGTAPIVTPARGQKITPRGRAAGAVRREMDDGSVGYPMMSAPHPTPPYRSISPKKNVPQFRSAQAAEEAHSREMMEAAQNALAPSNATMPTSGMNNALMEQQQSIVLPVLHQQQQQSHIDDGDLPRTPGKGHLYTPISSPLARRTMSESQESQELNMHVMQEPLRSNPDGLPVTPGGGRDITPGICRTPRTRTSTSESIPSGSQAISPQRQYMVSPTRQHVVLQSRSLHLSPHRQVMQGAHIKSPSGPSTMASAQQQMSSNAPMPSLHSQTYQQPPVVHRHVGQSPSGRHYYDIHGGASAPLITASGSNTYTPRRRKERDNDEAVEAEVNRNVKNILQAEKTHRLSTTSSHTLSPRNETSDDDDMSRVRHMQQIDSRRPVSKRNSPLKPSKRGQQSSQEETEEGEDDWEVACICGQTEDDGEEMVACDSCIRWEHVDCIFPMTKSAPEGKYMCHVCWPRPTELTPEQARAYQDRVKEEKRREKERDVKEKLAERAKRKEESSRKSSSTAMRPIPSKGATPKNEKPGSSQFRECDKSVYSPNAKRLCRLSSGHTADAEIINILKREPRVRSLVVEPNIHGLVATKDINDGSYLAELCGYVTLQKECPNRSLAPGLLNDVTFLFEKDGEKFVIDARKTGNFARYVRRSCKPNAELQGIMSGSELHIMIRAKDGTDIKQMDEVSIELEGDWRQQPRPAQGCACKDRKTCEIQLYFNQSTKSSASSHRRSLPVNGTTPKGGRSPVGRALTEKKTTGSVKKVVVKKGRKKGTIKLPRHSRKSKGGSTSTVDGSEGEEETEKEYEESTADEKEKEEVKDVKEEKEKKEDKSSTRRRRNTTSTSDGKVKEEKEEEQHQMAVVTATRSSTRIRNDSEVKKEVEDVVKDDKSEKKSNVDRRRSESERSKKGGRKSGVEKEKEIKEEVKEEPTSPSMKNMNMDMKKEKAAPKPWPVMNYQLPSERNKPSREERKLQAALHIIEKTEKKSRGSSSRGRPASVSDVSTTATPAARPKEDKQSSGRGKRRTETVEETVRTDSRTAAASTPLVPPPRKRWAADARKEGDKETSSPAPSSLSSMTSLKEDTADSPMPSGGKKKWLHRHQQEQKEKEEKAAEEAAAKKETRGTGGTGGTPTRSKRKKEERGAVEALLHMGGVEEKEKEKKRTEKTQEGNKEKMKRHAMQLKIALKTSAFSIESVGTVSGRVSLPSTCISTGPLTVPVPCYVSPSVTVPLASPLESGKAVKKTSLSIEEYRKRKQTGGSASVGEKREESHRKEEPPKKSFMPSVDASAYVPTSLPNVKLPGLEDTVGLDELSRRVYGESPRRGGTSTSTTTHTGTTDPTPKRQSINDRLKNEFSLPIRSAALSVTTTPTPTAAAAAATSSISPVPTGGQVTPGGVRGKHRLSDARAMNVEPPGLIECPRPTSALPPSTPSRVVSSTSVTASTSATSFFQRAGSVRSSK